ncbi:MAG TPA: plastocyanin/azurin family copper-binding protein [Candidatus Thermoplasmatota archaeon]|nr:plastocyanin/azurin family copper-binding protein [Candidatus Thermoplasmatota archaeon]
MKNLAFLLLAVLVAASAPAAAESKTFQFETHDDSGTYFTLEGQTAKNPTIAVAPGDEVTIVLNNVGPAQPHNWEIVGQSGASIACCLTPGQEMNVTFSAPSAGTYTYRCLPHESQGMKGTFTVASADMGGDDEDDDGAMEPETKSPGFEVFGALAAVGVAILVSRRR